MQQLTVELQLTGSVVQKQPPRTVLRKRCSKNMKQIYRRTPMPKCDFTLRHGCSPVYLLHIFRTSFTRSTTWWLLLHTYAQAEFCQLKYPIRVSITSQTGQTQIRSSRPEVFCKKGAFKNFSKFTGENLCLSLFFNKAACRKTCNFIKKEALKQVFSCEFCETFKITFFCKHLRWLLLSNEDQ